MSSLHQRTQLKPVPASALLDQELRRKIHAKRTGHVLTGCSEVDDHVLLGGLESGSVVGISSEDEDMGLLMGFQIVSRLLADASLEGTTPRAMVVSTLSTGLLLPRLREVLAGQLAARGCEFGEVQGRVRRCFESISLARVFDFEGLWEVLLELDAVGEAQVPREQDTVSVAVGGEETGLALSLRAKAEPGEQAERAEQVERAERAVQNDVLESSEEEKVAEPSSVDSSPLSSPPSSLPDVFDPDWEPRHRPRDEPAQGPPSPSPAATESQAQPTEPETDPQKPGHPPQPDPLPPSSPSTTPQPNPEPANEPTQQPTPPPPTSPLPDIILITHTSGLLNTLFTGRDKPTAHERTHLLSAKLRHLARSPSHGNPLVILLNSTVSAPAPSETTSPEEARPVPLGDPKVRSHQPEPTLRSVFTFSPAQQVLRRGVGLSVSKGIYSRPSFGLVFEQLMDLHLLCTRVPSGRERDRMSGGLVWVVEVLLDEVGVYEIEGEGEGLVVRRKRREQRWAAVGVEDGGRRVVGWR